MYIRLRKRDRLFCICGRKFQRVFKVYAYNLAAHIVNGFLREITGIRFYHKNGFLWAGGNENLNKVEFEEGILYRYTLKHNA